VSRLIQTIRQTIRHFMQSTQHQHSHIFLFERKSQQVKHFKNCITDVTGVILTPHKKSQAGLIALVLRSTLWSA